MVMTSCLMVYAALEHQIRKTLKEKACYFPDQKKKPGQNSTARWVFQYFENITLLYQLETEPLVLNLKDRQQTVINCLGDAYSRFIPKMGAECQIYDRFKSVKNIFLKKASNFLKITLSLKLVPNRNFKICAV
ncbi:MAG: hypothetical protein ACI936_003663 [Paraglaciecola sp.]|jgi:hypothetical protein